MWWLHLIPCVTILYISVSMPPHLTYFITKKVTGNGVKRQIPTRYEKRMLERDKHFLYTTGTYAGLECIPD